MNPEAVFFYFEFVLLSDASFFFSLVLQCGLIIKNDHFTIDFVRSDF